MVAIDSNSLILFGGVNEHSQKFNEIYFYELKEKKWTILFPSGQYPSPRSYHNMILCNQKILIFGGYSNSLLNDCFVLNLPNKYFVIKDSEKIIKNYLDSENKDNIQNINTENINFENCDIKCSFVSEFKEEINLLNHQVKELKNKLDIEINKNNCKVKYFFKIKDLF